MRRGLDIFVEVRCHRDFLIKLPSDRVFRRNRKFLRRRIPILPASHSDSPQSPSPPSSYPVNTSTNRQLLITLMLLITGECPVYPKHCKYSFFKVLFRKLRERVMLRSLLIASSLLIDSVLFEAVCFDCVSPFSAAVSDALSL